MHGYGTLQARWHTSDNIMCAHICRYHFRECLEVFGVIGLLIAAHNVFVVFNGHRYSQCAFLCNQIDQANSLNPKLIMFGYAWRGNPALSVVSLEQASYLNPSYSHALGSR